MYFSNHLCLESKSVEKILYNIFRWMLNIEINGKSTIKRIQINDFKFKYLLLNGKLLLCKN